MPRLWDYIDAMSSSSEHSITIDDRQIAVIIRKHPTARRMILRYEPRQQVIRVTIPRYGSFRQALHFAKERSGWIQSQLGDHLPAAPLAEGAPISILGVNYVIHSVAGRGKAYAQGDTLMVPGDASFMARRIREYVIKASMQALSARAHAQAAALGHTIREIKLRDLRSSWGSCTRRGVLTFSWRLGLAPICVLEYVASHEVAHLVHYDHSDAFWALVAQLCPDYHAAKAWLNQHGARLHQYC
jgi:predicted metal-dependent hydrolase